MSDQQVYQKVVNILAKQIFLGKLKPESKLPTEKKLSEEMKVDRTSLRVGLKQLESMKVLSIRQGDGIYVKDYLKNAGLDFLGFTFQQFESDSDKLDVDSYIMDEIWEFWIMFFPPVLELAIKRGSTRDFKSVADLIALEEKCIMDKNKLIDVAIRLQDKIAEIVNNTIVLLLFNSCRPLRKKIIKMLVHTMDATGLKNLIDAEKAFLQKAISGSDAEIAEGVNALRAQYESYRTQMRKLMSSSIERGAS